MNVQFTSQLTGLILRSPDDIKSLEGKNLLIVHNELSNANVKKFADRATGLKRTVKAFVVWQGQQTEKPVKEVEDPSKAPTYRPESNRGKIISLCSKAGGATIKDLMAATGWNNSRVKASLKRIESYQGLTVSTTGEGDDTNVVVTGSLRTRKAFAFDPKREIKEHKPGTKRAKVLELLQSKDGGTFEQIMAITNWDVRTAYEGIRLIHGYLGYGIRETGDGRISAFTK